ncbi:MAG: hypothetical protein FWC91_05020 [Defluviitaleaceae bacterium]|nr:hypothetical protein [Defluviitaleaceae bacterium]
MKQKKDINLKLQSLHQIQIPDVWDKIKDAPLPFNSQSEKITKTKSLRSTKSRFALEFGGVAACFIVLFGFLIMNNSNPNISDNIISGETEYLSNVSETSEIETIANTSPNPEIINSGEDMIIWNYAENITIDSMERIAGRWNEVTKEIWLEEFSLILPETLFESLAISYSFIFSIPRGCNEHHDGVNTTMPGCIECNHGNELMFGNILISDDVDNPKRWLSAHVSKITPEFISPFSDSNADVSIDSTLVSVSEISLIGETKAILSKYTCEFFGLRTYGLFDSQGYQITFEAVEFNEDMVIDFIKSIGATDIQ